MFQQSEEIKSPQDMNTTNAPAYGNDNFGMGAAQNAPEMKALKLKGLPFTVNEQDIHNFFQGTNVNSDSVKIGVMQDGRKTGEAAVTFNSDAECSAAHQQLDGKYIGSRWVKLIRVVDDEYENFENDTVNKYSGGGYNGGRGGRGGYKDYGGSDFGAYRGGRGDRGGDRGGRGRGGRGGRGRGGYDGGYGGNNFTQGGGA